MNFLDDEGDRLRQDKDVEEEICREAEIFQTELGPKIQTGEEEQQEWQQAHLKEFKKHVVENYGKFVPRTFKK